MHFKLISIPILNVEESISRLKILKLETITTNGCEKFELENANLSV